MTPRGTFAMCLPDCERYSRVEDGGEAEGVNVELAPALAINHWAFQD